MPDLSSAPGPGPAHDLTPAAPAPRPTTFQPYLTFPGTCQEALDLYTEVLGITVDFLIPFGGSPAANMAPPEWSHKVLHASFRLGTQILLASDVAAEHYRTPAGISLCLDLPSIEEAERVFNALSAGGTVTMPLQKTFWALRYGMFTDRFGIPWMINHGNPDN